MSFERLLSELAQGAVVVSLAGDRLRLRGPVARLTPELRELVARHRDALRTWLVELGDAPPATPFERLARDGELPLSSFQRRLWFVDQLRPGLTAYNIGAALRLRGDVDIESLRAALRSLVRRHESLRTTFEAVDGRPRARVREELDLTIACTDLAAEPPETRESVAWQLARRDASTPFDLAAGPLFRVQLIRCSAADWMVVFVFHHIVTDGWSLSLLARELQAEYVACVAGRPSPLLPLTAQYVDFARWHERWLTAARLDRHEEFWRRQLAGCPQSLHLPTDSPRPAVQSHRGATIVRYLSPSLTTLVHAASQKDGGRLFPFLLTVFLTLLRQRSGQDEFFVGTSIANRDRDEIAHMVGFFVNWLPIRADLRDDPSFAEALERVRATVRATFAHKDLPFERIVGLANPARDLSRQALFQTMFVLHVPMPEFALPGMQIEGCTVDNATAKVDVTLFMRDTPRGLECEFEYATDLFTPATMEAWADDFRALCEAAARDPSLRLSELAVPAAGAAEPAAVLRGAVTPPHGSLHGLFEGQAARTPGATALAWDGGSWSYAELDAAANRVAHRLGALGLGRGDRVGVRLPRSPELLAALLGALKAGCAYVPLDATYPAARIAFMVRDAALGALIVRDAADCAALEAGAPVVELASAEEALAGEPSHQPLTSAAVRAEDAAYVIYTSGSTGRAKGVVVPHGGVTNFVAWLCAELSLGPTDCVLQKTPISFDASIRELFPILTVGGSLALAPPEEHRDPVALVRRMRAVGATVLHAVPTLLRALLDVPEFTSLTSLRVVMSGGEALPVALAHRVARALPDSTLYNVYGPTEASVDATFFRYDGGQAGVTVPIGRPVWNTEVAVLDDALGEVSRSVTGEICILGRGLAEGYWAQPGLTAERFARRTRDGARLYRTGDLGRVRPDGALEFLGRRDDQVKVRGMRVEPAEVERALTGAGGVTAALVVAREGHDGNARLVGYVVLPLGTDRAQTLLDFRARLRRELPDYMVPGALVVLDALPLLPSGKVDRAALPEPPDGRPADEYVTPASHVAQAVADIWADVLDLRPIGLGDDFFALGGNSLQAVQVAARVLKAFGVDVPLQQFFDAPTVGALAAAVEAGLRHRTPPSPPLRATTLDEVPLSFAQQRLWFLQRLDPKSPFYNIPLALRFDGALDADVLARCVNEVVRRHAALRTTFPLVDTEPRQRVAPGSGAPLARVDLGPLGPAAREEQLRELIQREALTPFDLTIGPVLRATLVALGSDEHVLCVTMHHIVADGWSLGVCVRELVALYRAFAAGEPSPLPELALQYKDFAAWQRGWLDEGALAAQTEHFRRALAGAPASLSLPTDRPRPKVQSFRGRTHAFRLDATLMDALRALGRREGATLFMTLLAAFELLLSRYTRQDDFVVGAATANRTRAETEELIGFFVNTLALRSRLPGGGTFRALLGRVRAGAIAAYANQDVPFEHLVAQLNVARDLSRQAIFQVMFVLQNAPMPPIDLAGLRVSLLPVDRGTSKFDLTLFSTETAAGADCALEYNSDIFDPPTITHLAECFVQLLGSVVADPDADLAALNVLPEPQRQRVLFAWNAHAATEEVTPRLLHGSFDAQAKRTPEAPAVRAGGRDWSYAALDAAASRVAHCLASYGVGPGVRVGVAKARGFEYVAAILGVLRAGGAYVPLDIGLPRERLAFMIRDSEVALVLVDPPAAPLLASAGGRVLVHDDGAALPGSDAGPRALRAPGPDDPAYVIYTSGSTGQPKGVIVPHRGPANYLAWQQATLPVGAGDRVLHKTPLGFDASIRELFSPFSGGATLLLARPEGHRDATYLAALVRAEHVTALHVVPSLLAALLDEPDFASSPSLRGVMCGGEALSPELCARFTERMSAALFNVYGPTEASVDATWWRCDAAAPDRVPIGRPISNVRCYVLEPTGVPAPVGALGEIHISGAGVALGYVGDPARSREHFVPDAFAPSPGARMYRTGDLGRWRHDGALEYLGRRDRQCKVRGVRVELAEVEAALEAHPDVLRAVVVATDAPDTRLHAYVLPTAAARGEGGRDAAQDVARWRVVFEHTYESPAAPTRPDLDLAGWVSSETRAPIPVDEMIEWIDASVEAVRRTGARRILEVGCGTGLLLLRLAPGSERYVGVDFASHALATLRARADAAGLDRVELVCAAAHELDRLEVGAFDAVVLNSVTQYFPDAAYLTRVLDLAAARLAPGGTLLVGDVRHLGLLPAFHAAVSAAVHGDRPPSWRARRVAEAVRGEKELALAQEFFSTYMRHRPWVQGLDVRLRRGRHHNEMSRFRYDVALRGTAFATADFVVLEGGPDDELDRIAGALDAHPDRAVVVRGLRNSRVVEAVEFARGLASPDPAQPPGPSGARRRSVDPEDLWALGAHRDRATAVRWGAELESLEVEFEAPGAAPNRAAASVARPETPLDSGELAALLSPFANSPHTSPLPDLSSALREHLLARLPETFLPTSITTLAELPLNRSGKIDHAALSVPDEGPDAGRVPPRDMLEEAIAHAFTVVLGVADVGAHDDFFLLGGHSLLATQLLARVHITFGIDVPLRALFERPTVAALAAHVLQALRRGGSAGPPPLRATLPRPLEVPLSFAQQRLWFLHQIEPANPVYNVVSALRLSGPIDRGAFARAVAHIVRRHETLRTRFLAEDGRPRQIVDPVPDGPLMTFEDVPGTTDEARYASSLSRARDLGRAPFDLARGPLWRVHLLRLTDVDHVLVSAMHHIVSDGWSMGVLVRELGAGYSAGRDGAPPLLPDEPLQYADFALWQRGWLRDEALAREVEHHRRELAGALPLLLPTDHPRPALQSFRGAAHAFTMPPRLHAALRAFAQREGATLFMALLAGFEAVLHRWTGQTRFVIGTAIANRNRSEVEGLIGFFVNALPLRADLDGEPGFRALLRRVRAATLAAYAHQDVPFEAVVDALEVGRDAGRHPLFQVSILLQNAPLPEWALAGTRVRPLDLDLWTAKVDLHLDARETPEGLRCRLEYATDLFESATVERIAGHIVRLLTEALADAERPIARLPMLGDHERHLLLERWNATDAPRVRADLLHSAFERQAAARPEAIAIQDGNTCLTYEALDRRANQVAHRLRSVGVKGGALVLVALNRSVDFAVAVLAVLKAGGAYVPLDPALPTERLALVLRDTRAVAVLGTALWAERLPADAPPRVDPGGGELAGVPCARLDANVAPDDLAYVIYTSGSTGHPRGVMCTHRGIVDRVLANATAAPPLGPDDRFLHWFALSFDGAVICLFWPLSVGARVVLAPSAELADPGALAARIRDAGVTVVDMLPSMLRLVLDERALDACTGLRFLLTGAEECPPGLVDAARTRGLPLCNQYGPTEACVNATSWLATGTNADRRPIPIGRPLENTRAYVLDGHGELVPIGARGELYLGGVGVARGYLNDPEATAARFVPDLFAPVPGARLYRTGDVVRWAGDGVLEFHGRLDRQVKIRGFRVESAEVEEVIARHPSVAAAAVEVTGEGAARALVAYVSLRDGAIARPRDVERGRVSSWRADFDRNYESGVEPFAVRGWTSAYTGEALPPDELRAYVDEVARHVLATRPQEVLELGCGTGMLLARLAPECSRYVGWDLSPRAIEGLGRRTRALRGVELACREAAEIARLPAASFDAIVLSSTVQYFPSLAYLHDVLDGAMQALREGGVLYLGDVRNHALRRAFHGSLQAEALGDAEPVARLREQLQRALASEVELLVAPAFFVAWAETRRDVSRLRVELKRGHQPEEMLRFRYDVLVRRGPPRAALAPDVEVDVHELMTGSFVGLPDRVVVRGVPNARVENSAALVALLDDPACVARTMVELRARAKTESADAWDPEQICALASAHGYHASLRWSDGGVGAWGAFDAVLVRGAPLDDVDERAIRRPEGTNDAPAGNDPLRPERVAAHTESLRTYMREALPEYMVPRRLVILDALPRLASGKLDRATLPDADDAAVGESARYVPPRTPTERRLAALWCELLGVERVGGSDGFFALGGHSLLAAQLIARVAREFDRALGVIEVFQAPQLRDLARRIEQAPTVRAPGAAPVARRDATLAQIAMWDHQSAHPTSPLFNMPVGLRLAGSLDVARLGRALAAATSRHPALRSLFVSSKGGRGLELHVAEHAIDAAVPDVVDLRHLGDVCAEAEAARRAQSAAGTPFDLGRGPLVRATLLRLRDDVYDLVLNAHQAVFDGWSLGVWLSDVAAAYSDPPLPAAPREIPRPRATAIRLGHLDAWVQRALHLSPAWAIPGRARPWHGESVAITRSFPSPDVAPFARRAAALGATVFELLLAVTLRRLLARAHSSHFLVGVTLSGRDDPRSHGIVGHLVRTAPIEVDARALGAGTAVLLAPTRRALNEARRPDAPDLDEIAARATERLDAPSAAAVRARLFNCVVTWRDSPRPAARVPGVRVTTGRVVRTGESRYDLRIAFGREGPGVGVTVEHRLDALPRDLGAALADEIIAALTLAARE